MTEPVLVASAQGEDRSAWNPEVPWTKDSFGYCKATEGTSFVDPTFAWNFRELAVEGKPRGAYHFYHPALSPIDQAHFFWNEVRSQNPQPGDFLVADIEIAVGAGGWVISDNALRRMHQREYFHQGLSLNPPAHAGVITQGAKLFLDMVGSLAGPQHPVLVYTDLTVGSQLTSCTNYDLIIAYYSSVPPASVWPWDRWLMWQWAAGGGEGGGDRDAFNGDVAALLAWQAAFKPQPPPPPPSAAALQSRSGDNTMYLPNGNGAQAAFDVPPAVAYPDGNHATTGFVLNAAGITDVQYEFDNAGNWTDSPVDWNRSPEVVTLPAGTTRVKFLRPDSSPVLVTCSWR